MFGCCVVEAIRDTVAVSSMPYRTREAINSFPARRTDSDQHFHRTVLSERLRRGTAYVVILTHSD